MRRVALLVVPLVLLVAAGCLWLLWREPELAQLERSQGARPSVAGVQPAPAEHDVLAGQLAALRREPAGPARAASMVALLAAWAELAPALAMDVAAALADDEGRSAALHECLPHFLRADPEAARSWLLSAARVLPVEIMQALAGDAAAHDPELGFAVAQQLPVRARPVAHKDVFSAWASRDPRAAAEATLRLSRAEGHHAAVEEVARVWGERDAPSAFDWSARLSDTEARRVALLPVVGAWAARAPEAAAQSVAGLPFEPWRRRLIDDVVTPWARQDPERALTWVKTLNEPSEREAAATTLLSELLPSTPVRAADWALALGGGAASPVVDKIVAAWVARDPAAALAWASRAAREQGAAQAGAHDTEGGQLVAGALERWRQQDPQAAETWLRGHPARVGR
jgi:hypothetical protein